MIRSLGGECGKDVAFGKVSPKDSRELAKRLPLRSIPSYVLFKEARIVERFSGATTRDRPARKIEKLH